MTTLFMFWSWSLNSFGKVKKLNQIPSLSRNLVENLNEQLKLRQILYLAKYGLI